ncbi:SDR family oxidoreductase [Haloarchaeobius sp. HRN-SO-5]|uniref:SDR family oxidoreductase n=1 Tax=Haloarchaeobius sp. HRN-SO-5 TaxID=3446118 RepID=UPI003EBC16C6
MDLELEGNVALTTASTSGLGRASALALAREGAHVVVNGRDTDRLADAVDEIDAAGSGRVLGVPADISTVAGIETLVERTRDEFDRLDHVVTSAGGPPSGSFVDTTDEDWYDAYDLLVMSVVRLLRAVSDDLAAGDGGSVALVASRTVTEPADDLVLSNAVRSAVVGLGKTLSREFAPEVRVNYVLPGAHETARMQELARDSVERGDYESYEDALDDWAADVPVERVGDPQELGDTVAYLCSPRAGYVNGESVLIDGGASRSV